MPSPTLKNVRTTTPIIGLTGAIGSGCTHFAEGLAKFHGYKYQRLSTIIREAIEGQKTSATTTLMQDIGDQLRKTCGRDVLVRVALERADADFEPTRDRGIVLDGIRNCGEVETLRRLPNFYMIAVQAERETRRTRLLKDKRFATPEAFDKADERDADAGNPNGQQVTTCNDWADIVITNNDAISPVVETEYKKHVQEKLYSRFIETIEAIAERKPFTERRPDIHETCMTMAYCVSTRSQCCKRQVGAVITTAKGDVIAVGYNDVPRGKKGCLSDPDYQQCKRDAVQAEIANGLKFCPACGKKVEIKCYCRTCREHYNEVRKSCPACGADLAISAWCGSCERDVFDQFLPGFNRRSGKMLDLCRALHAEENAILSAARNGPPIPNDAIMYCTTYPCNLCANKIVNSGITTVYYSEPYDMPDASKLFASMRIDVKRFEGVKSTAYFRLYGQVPDFQGGR